jgi:hypothetical protein
MHVPVDDQHTLRAVPRPRVVRTDGDVAEQAESHPRAAKRMVPGRPNGAEASSRASTEREVDAVQHGARASRRRRPRSLAHHRVRIEARTSGLGELLHHGDVASIVREPELVCRRVPRLTMLQPLEQLEVVAQRARNRPQPPDVLGMPPAGVVATAVGVGEVGYWGHVQGAAVLRTQYD